MSARPPFTHASTSYADHHAAVQVAASPSTSSSASSSKSASSSNSSNSGSSASKPSAPTYHLSTAPYSDFEYPLEKAEPDTPDYPAARPYEPFRFAPPRARMGEGQLQSRRGSWKDRVLAKNDECKGGRLGKALIIGWVVTTVMFVVATAFYKGELFAGESNCAEGAKASDD